MGNGEPLQQEGFILLTAELQLFSAHLERCRQKELEQTNYPHVHVSSFAQMFQMRCKGCKYVYMQMAII